MKKNIFFLILFIAILIGFAAYFGLYQVTFFSSRASIKATQFSVDNSFVVVTPLRVRADGQEKARVSAAILSDQGLGVQGKNVTLGQDKALNYDNIQSITDNVGKAIIDISSTKPGEYYLKVFVDGTALPQEAHLSFY